MPRRLYRGAACRNATSSSPAPAGASAQSILAALAGHKVVGHSTRGGEGLIAADLAAPGAAQALWDEALERLGGRIDVLVNNAGIFEAAPIDRTHEDWVGDWERTLQVNLIAAAELCRLAVLHFRERRAAGGSSTSPAAPPIAATAPTTGIMPRPRPAWSA